MKQSISQIFYSKTLIFACLFIFAGCKAPELNSTWVKGPVTIDGNDKEWEGVRVFIKDMKAALGVYNDSLNLYVMVSTRDKALQRRILSEGLNLWLNPDKRDKKSYGLSFPCGGSVLKRPGGQVGVDSLMVFKANNHIQIKGKGSTLLTLAQAHEQGVDFRAGYHQSTLIVEFKIPFKTSTTSSLAVDISDSRSLYLGLEAAAPELKYSQMKGRSSRAGGAHDISEGMGGGMGEAAGRGGMSSMGGGGKRGGSHAGGVEPVEQWVFIKLAEEI